MKWLIAIVNWSERTIAVLLGAVVLIIFYNTLARYFPISADLTAWPEEIGRLLFVWIVFISASSASFRGLHFGIDLLTASLGQKSKKIVGGLINAVVAVMLVILEIAAIYSLWTLKSLHYPGLLQLPVKWFYLAVVVGCLLMCVYTCVNLVQSFRKG